MLDNFKKIEIEDLENSEIISYSYICENYVERDDSIVLTLQCAKRKVKFFFKEKIFLLDHKIKPISFFGINSSKEMIFKKYFNSRPEFYDEVVKNQKYNLFQFVNSDFSVCFEIICYNYSTIKCDADESFD